MKLTTKLWLFIAVMALLTPLGILLPEHFKAGAAWGEWGPEEVQALIGYIPQGLARFATLWHAPVPDYAFKGWEGAGLPRLSLAYIVSALAGICLTVLLVLLVSKMLIKSRDK